MIKAFPFPSTLLLLLFLWITHEAESNCWTGRDLFPDKIRTSDSSLWNIDYCGTYKVIINKQSQKKYLLYQRGTDPPPNAEKNHHVVISVPVKGVALTQTTQIPHLELLGIRTSIKAYIGDPSWISSSCVNELISDGEIEIINQYDRNAIDGWLRRNPDSVIFGHPWSDSTEPNMVIISESQETNNMATFEWQKVYAAFFNLEKEANEIFEDVEDDYDCIADKAVNNARGMSWKPKIVWAYYSTYAKAWDVASCPNYYCEYAAQCGAEFLHSNGGSVDVWGYKYMTLDEFVNFARDADYWVYASPDWNEVYTNNFSNKRALDRMKSVRSKNVFDTSGYGQNAWFEQRMAEPDIVLGDFCSIVGTLSARDHDRVWLRNVFTERRGSNSRCRNVNAPLEKNSVSC